MFFEKNTNHKFESLPDVLGRFFTKLLVQENSKAESKGKFFSSSSPHQEHTEETLTKKEEELTLIEEKKLH